MYVTRAFVRAPLPSKHMYVTRVIVRARLPSKHMYITRAIVRAPLPSHLFRFHARNSCPSPCHTTHVVIIYHLCSLSSCPFELFAPHSLSLVRTCEARADHPPCGMRCSSSATPSCARVWRPPPCASWASLRRTHAMPCCAMAARPDPGGQGAGRVVCRLPDPRGAGGRGCVPQWLAGHEHGLPAHAGRPWKGGRATPRRTPRSGERALPRHGLRTVRSTGLSLRSRPGWRRTWPVPRTNWCPPWAVCRRATQRSRLRPSPSHHQTTK